MDVKASHLECLNLKVTRDVRGANLIHGEIQAATATRADGKGGTERLVQVLKELEGDTDAAFREIVRLPPLEGRPKVKLLHSRKFWTALERMAQYWDDSRDEYYEVPEKPELSLRLTEKATDADEARPMTMKADANQVRMKHVYRGRRTGAGKDMPDQFRDDVVNAFVEMAAWAFSCQITMPGQWPRLAVQNLLVPVRHNFIVGRSPRDRQLARRGVLEGPVMAVQCRSETEFRPENTEIGAGNGEICDLLREVGAMILLAQERAKEGCKESRPGEGQWWTMTPRWGGGPGGPGPLDEEEPAQAQETKKRPLASGDPRKMLKAMEKSIEGRVAPVKRENDGDRRKISGTQRMRTLADKWKVVRAGSSGWDKRLRYERIGMNRKAGFDEIYMVSSINHHLAILHLRIHPEYLGWLSKGQSPNWEEGLLIPLSIDEQTLDLQRTKWYNLLDALDRGEAMRNLWLVMGWLTREDAG